MNPQRKLTLYMHSSFTHATLHAACVAFTPFHSHLPKAHASSVVVMSKGGGPHRLITGSSDQSCRIWDLRERRALTSTLRGHTDCITSLEVDSAASLIVSGSRDQTARLWDCRTGRAKAVMRKHLAAISAVAVRCTDHLTKALPMLVTASRDSSIKLWDEQGNYLTTWRHKGLSSMAMQRHVGGMIATAGSDSHVRLWGAGGGTDATPRMVGALAQQGRKVTRMHWMDSDDLVVASSDKAMRVYDAQSGAIKWLMEGHACAATHVTTCTDSTDASNVVASADADGSMFAWHLR